jgi:uncharacterized protein YbaR (Trm112 family)
VSENKSLRLVCPYCGGRIDVEIAREGAIYPQNMVLGEFYCVDCGAEWAPTGDPIGPSLVGSGT